MFSNLLMLIACLTDECDKFLLIISFLYDIVIKLYVIRGTVACRHVGMADDADSKSVVGNHVWVQVPLPALKVKLSNHVKRMFKAHDC